MSFESTNRKKNKHKSKLGTKKEVPLRVEYPASKMNNPVSFFLLNLKSKLRSEHLSDAIRTTICIFLPIVLFFYLKQGQMAIATGTGALLIAATDGPNTLKGKAKAAVENLILFALTSMLMASLVFDITATTICLLVLVFIYAMLACYGNRYALSGTMATALAIFIIGLKPNEPIAFTLGLVSGGTFYYLISILHQLVRPYRSLEQAIVECLQATANFVKTKVDCYDPNKNLAEAQSENILQHIKVSEKQQLVRTLLLSEKQASMLKSKKGKRLFNQCITLIDLYQQFSASHHHYKNIQLELNGTGTLEAIRELIYLQAHLLANLNGLEKNILLLKKEFEQKLSSLKEMLALATPNQKQIVTSVISNLNDIYQLILQFVNQQDDTNDLEHLNGDGYVNFITSPKLAFSTLKSHLSFTDPTFRFSLRLSLLISFTYLVTEMLKLSHYTYWILLTILVVARPKLALTWKRNKQRIVGTLIGISISIIIMMVIKNSTILISVTAIFLTGFFLYSRLNYLKAVASLTPAILIALALYSGNWVNLMSQRLLFTIIGCAIAIPTAYLFPIWETNRVNQLLINTYLTALDYLKATIESEQNAGSNLLKVRLARKNNYLATAELSEAMQMIKIEPKSKSFAVNTIQHLQTAAYQISAIISSISLTTNSSVKLSQAEQKQAVELLEKNLMMVKNLQTDKKFIDTPGNTSTAAATSQSAVLNSLSQIHRDIKTTVSY